MKQKCVNTLFDANSTINEVEREVLGVMVVVLCANGKKFVHTTSKDIENVLNDLSETSTFIKENVLH